MAEFSAAYEFAKQVRRIEMTAVVDDDYPEVRHDYEGALRVLIGAVGANRGKDYLDAYGGPPGGHEGRGLR